MSANSTPRAAKAAKHRYNSGRRPHRSAMRPTHGANSATMSCGTTIQAPIRVDAHSLERIVRMLPINGSIAAFASWNSRMQPAKASSRRLLNALRHPIVAAPVGSSFRRSTSLVRMRASANMAGAASTAVRKNTAWFETKYPQAPIAAAATPLPIDAKRALRPSRAPKAA